MVLKDYSWLCTQEPILAGFQGPCGMRRYKFWLAVLEG